MRPLVRFSDLPTEIVIQILSFLGLQDLLAFASTNRINHTIYTSTPSVQLRAALFKYGMTDGDTSLDVSSKLSILKQRERLWQRFSPSRSFSITFQHCVTSLYEIEAGVYISGDAFTSYAQDPTRTTALRAFDFKACTEKGSINERVLKVRAGGGSAELNIVEIGVALKEFDLIALVTSEDRSRSGKVSVGVHLHQFSTFDTHPLAELSYVHLMDLRDDSIGLGQPSATVLISGKHLVLLLRLPVWPGSHLQSNMFFVVNWLTGAILVRKEDLNQEIGDIAFLSHDLIVLPNIVTGRIEVARLPKPMVDGVQADLETVLILVLPFLHVDARYRSAYCRASCNPSDPELEVQSTERDSWRKQIIGTAYKCDPEQAVILTRFNVEGNGGFESCVFWMIFRRSDMLDFVRGQVGKFDQVHRIPGIREDMVIPWAKWGERLTRWRTDKEMSFWMTTSAGQRLAILRRNKKVKLWDFNPYSVKRARQETSLSSPPGKDIKIFDLPTVVRPRPNETRFFQDIISGLPYVEHEFELPQEYEGIHLDEDHLIAFNTEQPRNTIVNSFAVFPV